MSFTFANGALGTFLLSDTGRVAPILGTTLRVHLVVRTAAARAP